MKYLIAAKKCPDGSDLLFPVLFPDMLTHSSIAAGLQAEERAAIRSAGFFSIEFTRSGSRVCTHDHSASLSLSPHPDDAILIRDWLRYGDAFSLGSQLLAATMDSPGDPLAPPNQIPFPSPVAAELREADSPSFPSLPSVKTSV